MNAMLPTHSLPLDMLLAQHVSASAQLTSDTRMLKAGDVMLAYPVGNAHQISDSRLYISKALNLGAALVLYEPSGLTGELVEVCKDPRCVPVADLAKKAGGIAANWYQNPSSQMRVIGITGTNGKTTVSQWVANALHEANQPSAVVGTLGAGLLNQIKPTGFTTPDAARLQSLLNDIKDQGAASVAMEVSSHALDQERINGVEFDTVVITNLSQDHLDYHGTMSEYAAAKKKIINLPGVKHIVINADDAFGQECLKDLADRVANTSITVWAYATQAEKLLALPCFTNKNYKKVLASDIHLMNQGMTFNLNVSGEDLGLVQTNFVGTFNVSNALAVFACVVAGGKSHEQAKEIITQLKPVKGRMELVTQSSSAPMAIVDFAHTPDALEQVLKTLRVIAGERKGQLWCVFGCGGDRDVSKRPMMGRIAERYADQVMITSDNPRSENPEQIIAEILSGFESPDRVQVNPDRATAILQTIRQAKPEDVVLVAGKGHEETQEIAGKKHPFSDQMHLQLAMGGLAI